MSTANGGSKVDRLPMTVLRTVWQQCLLAFWAVWWGGLTFYAAVVVPIGSKSIGSVDQGFITQQVTSWHNRMSILFCLILLSETARRRCRGLAVATILLIILTASLVILHGRLTSVMDFIDKSVPDDFYSQHAVYLWLTTGQWLLGMTVPWWIPRPERRWSSASTVAQ